MKSEAQLQLVPTRRLPCDVYKSEGKRSKDLDARVQSILKLVGKLTASPKDIRQNAESMDDLGESSFAPDADTRIARMVAERMSRTTGNPPVIRSSLS